MIHSGQPRIAPLDPVSCSVTVRSQCPWLAQLASRKVRWLGIEQNRLIWLDIPNRTKHLTKALRRAQHPALAPITPQPKSFKSTQNLSNDKRPCPEFQTLSCTHPATHTEDGLTWLHNCATCLRVKGQKYSHPKAECNRQKAMDAKSKGSKNE